MQKNNKIKDYPDQQDSPQKKNSKARIKATDKYNKANYKNLSIRVKPDQAEKIRDAAQRHHLSLAQLIITAVDYFDTNHQPQPQPQQEQEHTDIQTAGEPDTTTTTTTTSNNGETETETETETDFDWIDELYKQGKTEQREKNNG